MALVAPPSTRNRSPLISEFRLVSRAGQPDDSGVNSRSALHGWSGNQMVADGRSGQMSCRAEPPICP